MNNAIKKSLADLPACISYGFGFGVVGLFLGYLLVYNRILPAGLRRISGMYSGVEPSGCWTVAFALGIYTLIWMRRSPANRGVGLVAGCVRAIVTLLPLGVMSAAHMVYQTSYSSPYIPAPFKEQALRVSIVYVVWLLGIVAAGIVVVIITFFRGIGRRVSNRAIA